MNARSRLATLEAGAASQEEHDFTNVVTTRFAAPGHNGSTRVARLGLSSGQGVGPGKILTVQQGDTITFTSYAWLTAAVAAGSTGNTMTARSTSVVVLAAPLPAPTLPPLPPASAEGSTTSASQVRVGVSFALGASPAASAPLPSGPVTNAGGSGFPGVARLHYIVRDKDGVVKLDDYQTANPAAPGTWQQLQVGLRLAQGGTVELSVETDGASGPDVFFDDTQVQHTSSPIVQEQHSYAYGAPMLGLNYTVGSKSYRHGYQGQFAEKDEETGLDAFELRLYDSRIGRWTAPDPEGQYDSPYVGMGNNPVSGVDPDGGLDFGAFLARIRQGFNFGKAVALNEVVVIGHQVASISPLIGRAGSLALAGVSAYGAYSGGLWNAIGSDVLPESLIGYQSQMGGAFGNGQLVGHFVSGVGGALVTGAGAATTGAGFGVTLGSGGLLGEVSLPMVGAGLGTMRVGAGIMDNAIGRAQLNMNGRSKPDLPSLDRTGKVHGELPKRSDLSKFSPDELRQLQGELKQSIKQRIRKTVQLGRDKAHGQRQAAEQQLLKDIETHLNGK